VIIGTYNGDVLALKGNGEIAEGWPLKTDEAVEMAPAVKDIDNDGILDIIVPNSDLGGNAKLYRFRKDGINIWENDFEGDINQISCITISDVNLDGFDEIVFVTKNKKGEYRLCMVDHKGVQLWDQQLEGEMPRWAGQYTDSALVIDLIDDQKKEIVIPVFMYDDDGFNGTIIKVFDYEGVELFSNFFNGGVGNIVGINNEYKNNNLVVFVITKYDRDKPRYKQGSNEYYLLMGNEGGINLKKIVEEVDVGHDISTIALGDMDNNGEPEIIGIGNKGPSISNYCLYGAIQLNIYTLDGDLQFSKTIDDTDYCGIIGMPFISDITGDGFPEVLFMVNNFRYMRSDVYAIDCVNDVILENFPFETHDYCFALGISDITGNNRANIIVASGRGIQVWEVDTLLNVEKMEWSMFQHDPQHSGCYESSWTGNYPPSIPEIMGPSLGKIRQVYEYTFVTTDIDGDNVYYYIDWGNEDNEEWIGPYGSGEQVTIKHTWKKQGTYIIRVKAKDNFDAESDWTTLEVSMPKNKAINPFMLFLERLIEQFPLLEQILQPIYDKLTGF